MHPFLSPYLLQPSPAISPDDVTLFMVNRYTLHSSSLAGQTLFLGIARAEGAQKRVWKTDSSAFVLTPTNFLVGVKLLKA